MLIKLLAELGTGERRLGVCSSRGEWTWVGYPTYPNSKLFANFRMGERKLRARGLLPVRGSAMGNFYHVLQRTVCARLIECLSMACGSGGCWPAAAWLTWVQQHSWS